jgi:putative serine protease PepD
MTMRRAVLALGVVAALALSACTTGSTNSATTQGTTAQGTATEAPRANFPSSSTAIEPGQGRVIGVVRSVLPAVVNVVNETADGGKGEGTGFIVRSDGIIVTNFHVVEGASKVTVLTSADDPVSYDARVIGGDVEADIAILKVDATGLPTVPLGSSNDLQLGQPVVAIGYALGLSGGPSVTDGIVSSLTRQITVPDERCTECSNGQRVYTNGVQTDAAINPGNSGGPLVNLAGQVVGINTAGANSAENIGFAIQVDAAKPIIFQAAEHPSQPVAFMGITSAPASDPQVQFQFNPPTDQGAVIVDLVPGGPAADAGIVVGDVIVQFDGKSVTDSEQLGNLIHEHSPRDRVAVGLVHADGSNGEVTVTLGTNPVATT